jgi:hypothetical protein
MLLYFLLQIGFNRLNNRIKKQTVLRGYTITVLILVLFGFSTIQLKFIETYQTSEFQACSYYDDYGNAIYYSSLQNSCPELDILEQTDTYLSFEVYESAEGYVQNNHFEIVGDGNYDYKAKMRTNIELAYDSEGNILQSDMRRSTNVLAYNDSEEIKVYNSITTSIANEIIVISGEPMGFRSLQTTGIFEDALFDFDDVNQVEHRDEIQFTYTYKEYLSEKSYKENNDATLEELYQIVISENLYDNADYTGVPIESTVVQLLDFVCDSSECRIKREDMGVSREDYDLLVNADLIEFDIDHTYTISEDKIELTYPTIYIRENAKEANSISYSAYKNYGLVLDSVTLYEHELQVENYDRSGFKYGGNQYLEIGKFYRIIYETDYGLMVKRKLTASEQDVTMNPPISTVSSRWFTPNIYYNIDNIYDYGSRALYNPDDRDEIIYQENPLISSLISHSR